MTKTYCISTSFKRTKHTEAETQQSVDENIYLQPGNPMIKTSCLSEPAGMHSGGKKVHSGGKKPAGIAFRGEFQEIRIPEKNSVKNRWKTRFR